MMFGAGFNGIEALRSRVLMDVEALGEWFRKAVLCGIVNVYVRSGLQCDRSPCLCSHVLMDVKTLGQKFGKGVL